MLSASLNKTIPFFLESDYTPPKCGELTEYILAVLTLRWVIFLQYIWMGQMCMTDAGTTQDNFILPEPCVGGLPIFQDRLDRKRRVGDRTIPIILPSGKNILAETVQCGCLCSWHKRYLWNMSYSRGLEDHTVHVCHVTCSVHVQTSGIWVQVVY